MKKPRRIRRRLGVVHHHFHKTKSWLDVDADVSRAMVEPLEPRLLMSASFVNSGIAFPGGKAFIADYNLDGWSDVGTDNAVYRNAGGNGFTTTGSQGGQWGDFDNDGYVDLYAYSNGNLVRNKEGNGFVSVSALLAGYAPQNSAGAAWADLNGDGLLDLYVGGYELWDSAYYPDNVLIQNANGSFDVTWTQPIDAVITGGRPRPARGVMAADFDHDGDVDIYTSNYRLEPNGLYINDGNGNITDQASARGATGGYGHTIGSAHGDVDNDGDLDIFVGSFSHNWGGSPRQCF